MSSRVRSTAPALPSPRSATSGRRRMVPLLALAAVLTVLTLADRPAPAANGVTADRADPAGTEVGLLTKRTPAGVEVRRGPAREVGMRFTPKVAGEAVGLRYYKPSRRKAASPRTATLWSRSGRVLARADVRAARGTGWRSVDFGSSVTLKAGRAYVVSVHTRGKGIHAATPGGFRTAKSNASLRAPGDRNGWTRRSGAVRFPGKEAPRDTNYWIDVRFVPASDDTTTTTPPPTGGWPGPDNTGVPAGTTLTPYAGPCTIRSAVTITAVDATAACDAIVVQARGVVIDRSLVPGVWSIYGDGASSVTITDSDVRAGATSTGAIWGYNITARRVDATGGQHSFQCNDNCEVTDSWLHDQYNPAGESYHNNAFISNGGRNMVVRHNTLHCTAILNNTDGGCTADVSLFGDFDPIDNVLIENNFLRANNSSISYCAYGGDSKSLKATNVRFVDNVFERGPNRRCGVYGPVTDFDRTAAGNQWSGNVWDSGEVVNP